MCTFENRKTNYVIKYSGNKLYSNDVVIHGRPPSRFRELFSGMQGKGPRTSPAASHAHQDSEANNILTPRDTPPRNCIKQEGVGWKLREKEEDGTQGEYASSMSRKSEYRKLLFCTITSAT